MKVIKIGSDPMNDYVVSHPFVSAYHAEIYIFNNNYMQYVDHSTNGTMINGIFVHRTPYMLKGNEFIQLPGGSSFFLNDIIANIAMPEPPEDFLVELRGMGFGETLGYYFNHYADFDGRARRREYWFICLWNIIFGIIPIVNILWYIITFIPSLALSVRRLHDVGKSGCWLLMYLVPLVGYIMIFIWLVTDSDSKTNKYGPSPKYSTKI